MKTTWHLYRTKNEEWVVYNGPRPFTTPDRRQAERRLKKYGVRPSEIEEFFQGEAKSGEGVITVPIGLERQLASAGLTASLTSAPIEVKRSPFLRPAVRMCGSASMLRDGSEIPS
jgi:hypothetical protein